MNENNSKSFEELLKNGQKEFFGETINVDRLEDKKFESINFFQSEIQGVSFKKSCFENISIKSCFIKEIDFSYCRFHESFATNYTFEKNNFSEAVFKKSDFSGGGFDQVNFSNAIFEECDFALCEFQECTFDNAKFVDCNFNASIFEKTTFEKTTFTNSTFKFIEGLNKDTMNKMKQYGAIVCPPYEIALKNMVKNLFSNLSLLSKFIIIALISFVIGFYAKPLYRTTIKFFTIEANPLSFPLKQLKPIPKSYFFYNFNLPNYDFSEGMDNWLAIYVPPLNKTLEISSQDFSTFPYSLKADKYTGKIFHIKKAKTTIDPKRDILENTNIWLPVKHSGEKLKISFYYKIGHPKFTIMGRFKDGGYKIISEIDSLIVLGGEEWIYFSESVKIPSNFNAICLKLSQFPEQLIYLDDINLETTI